MIFSELSVKQLMLKDFRNILDSYLNSPAKAFLGATMLSFHIPSAMLVMLHELDGPFSLPRLSVFQDGLEGGRVGRRRGGVGGVWGCDFQPTVANFGARRTVNDEELPLSTEPGEAELKIRGKKKNKTR